MPITTLRPTIEHLSQEFVLVQAWKKASTYIRYHNWFSDTLELDRIAVNLPEFIVELSREISSGKLTRSCPLRIVPAPKSQQWHIDDNGSWKPVEDESSSRIRPLAHVTLKDQVVATAMMICLADRVETLQGQPRAVSDIKDRKKLISYGNRLLCDTHAGSLKHRWGSTKLYRGYFEDYQYFLERPEEVAASVARDAVGSVAILHSDLRQFYDRVTHRFLVERVNSLKAAEEETGFFELFASFMDWRWADEDLQEIQDYAKRAGISNFERVSLPQGLVASGFFANVVLLPFDGLLSSNIGKEIIPNVKLEDAARYVDDLRLVLSKPGTDGISSVEDQLKKWLQALLEETAPCLAFADEKTKIASFSGDGQTLVQQGRRMKRIQTAISGGFDAIAGGEILDAVMGLIRTQQRLSTDTARRGQNPFLPVPDVRDATIDRFAAGRFRTTYRSLRPLLWQDGRPECEGEFDDDWGQFGDGRTRAELDDDAKAFALDMITKWVNDPSNVRLLRIALDLWPEPDVLRKILALMRPYTTKGSTDTAAHRVAWYCLSEIFRAGATETGVVEDDETLPSGIKMEEYRRELEQEARRIVAQTEIQLPWYLQQQAFLFLAVRKQADLKLPKPAGNPGVRHYLDLIRFLRGGATGFRVEDYATYAILARRSFLNEESATALVSNSVTSLRFCRIATLDPNFGRELLTKSPGLAKQLSARIRADLGLMSGDQTLAKLVLSPETRDVLRNEISLITFSLRFLEALNSVPSRRVLTPSDIKLKLSQDGAGFRVVESVTLPSRRDLDNSSLYDPPLWAEEPDRWRFQLGYLLRFILAAQQDFTRRVRTAYWREDQAVYRAPESHWYQRIYGMFNGHSAFGDDWLPVSDWTENLLFRLLRWPGCSTLKEDIDGPTSMVAITESLQRRLEYLMKMQGTNTPLMPVLLPLASNPSEQKKFRAGIVQTIIPGNSEDFDEDDLVFSKPAIRTRHRRHLSAALAAVKRVLALRETHKGKEGGLDLLILPELAVHPDDVITHLVPFARAYGTTIVAGLTYQALGRDKRLVNSAIWIIPTRDSYRGSRVMILRQGKGNLSPVELKYNQPFERLRPFRPCQWLIGYRWSLIDEPLWATAAICYDATSIRLAASLRDHSDIFIVPALNQDVNTFDQMALALHYHMFQMVIVANNGSFGGSNAYAPFVDAWERRIFHVHGQPQASITFFEIDDVVEFKARKDLGKLKAASTAKAKGLKAKYKYPPAEE